MDEGMEKREGSSRSAIVAVVMIVGGVWVAASIATLLPFIGTFGNPESDTLLEEVTEFVWGANLLGLLLLGIGAAIIGMSRYLREAVRHYARLLRDGPHKPQR